MIYLFDIDGTLANCEHRLHFIQDKPADWNSFFMAADEDEPIWETITIARSLFASGHTILLTTGRSDVSRTITAAWMAKYRVPHSGIYMRKTGDHREDNVVKSELLDQMLQKHPQSPDRPKDKIAGVFEDRQQVVDMYRARGLRVFQVAPGNF